MIPDKHYSNSVVDLRQPRGRRKVPLSAITLSNHPLSSRGIEAAKSVTEISCLSIVLAIDFQSQTIARDLPLASLWESM